MAKKILLGERCSSRAKPWTVTIQLTLAALVLSTLPGIVWTLMRLSPSAFLRWLAVTFITIIRGIPIIVQAYYMCLVLPDLDIQLFAFPAEPLPRTRSFAPPIRN